MPAPSPTLWPIARRFSQLLLLLAVLGCGDQAAHNAALREAYNVEFARLQELQAERRELVSHYELTLQQVEDARTDLRKIHQQRIETRSKAGAPGLQTVESYQDDVDDQLAPQLAKVRATYDSAIQQADKAIKDQTARVDQAGRAAGL